MSHSGGDQGKGITWKAMQSQAKLPQYPTSTAHKPNVHCTFEGAHFFMCVISVKSVATHIKVCVRAHTKTGKYHQCSRGNISSLFFLLKKLF
jgi:hypothetical protein